MRKIKCNKCGFIGDESEFTKDRDFLQREFISSCPKKCGNFQTPGEASLRMMPGKTHPFEFVREGPEPKLTIPEKVIKDSNEAS